jgi:hypothetical protein
VQSWFDPAALSVQEGPRVCQLELRHGGTSAGPRLALVSPVVSFPPVLAAGRQACLFAVLAVAHELFRMVRIGTVRRPGRVVVVAEVDFSGAPHSLLPLLVPAGLDALRWAIRRLIPILGLVVDSGVPSQALDEDLAGFRAATFSEVVHE